MSELINQISKLSIIERIQLVQAILSTIAKDTEVLEQQAVIAIQQQEIEHRSASIAKGKAKTISWTTIEQKLSKRSNVPWPLG